MMWNVSGTLLDNDALGNLAPVEILYEYEGPRIFTASHCGRPVLAYESDCDDEQRIRRLLVVPTSDRIVRELKEGMLSISDSLKQPWLHAVDQSFDGTILAIWHISAGLESVPEKYKPVEGTLLSAELEHANDSAMSVAGRSNTWFASSEVHLTYKADVVLMYPEVPSDEDAATANVSGAADVEVAKHLESPANQTPLNHWPPANHASNRTLH